MRPTLTGPTLARLPLAAAVLAPLLAAACASQPVKTAQPTTRAKIPAVLIESAANPYAPPKLATCKVLAAEQARLDRVLGPESEAPKPNRSALGRGGETSKPNRSPARTLAQWLSAGSAEAEFSTRAMALWLNADASKPGQSAEDKDAEFAARVLAQWFNAGPVAPRSARRTLAQWLSSRSDTLKTDPIDWDTEVEFATRTMALWRSFGDDAPKLDRMALRKDPALVARDGTKATTAPIETWLPLRTWVSTMSVAEQHSRPVQGAVAAGLARRAYLKGRAQSQGCPNLGPQPIYLFPGPPHTPSSVAQN